ncbi:DNA helicase PIF1, ATP-dependent [Tanacetum coccineum]|uniref:ATP-dependent DNA helicase n=1 Tax=Tanacetum coccineum TaxID=301880 RepID=A0ABQ5G8T3_9ASTR
MGSLLPVEGVPLRYAQLYFFDTQNEIMKWMSAFMEKEKTKKVDENTVIGLIQMLDRSNALAQSFRMTKEWCWSRGSQDFSLRLISERTTSRQYNAPTVSEVAAWLTSPKLHGIAIPSVVSVWRGQGTTLLRGGWLFQQYLVDAFTTIEEQRLKWTRNNQDTLRVDMYHNLYDVNYKDAMALCRAYGNPDLFITFTSNPKWVEISDMLALIPGQKLHDRHVFGDCCAVVYVIEFKKRGLPQAHILLWLEEHFKCMTPDELNNIIAAELPSPTEDLDGYKVMSEFMLHGPCGKDAKYAPCTTEGKCLKHYPKVFLEETVIDEDGYPIYRRRNNKVTAKKGKFTYNNQHVVPYNRYLLLKYQAHINVEWCNRSNETKYLFKYLNKGPDRAAIVIHENVTTGADGASLNYHLPNQNAVTLRDFEDLPALLEKDGINITMFTDWFELNKRDPVARDYTYDEIPQHYVWHAQHKIWRPRKQKKCIGRIVYSSPTSEERYYLRMLLNVVRGAQSFEKLMTVNKQTYATFKAACFAYGLLNDDKEWSHAIAEANHGKKTGPLYRKTYYIKKDTLQLHSLLNLEQRMVYDKVIEFAYSESGIASLLLLGGRTTHNRFVIPLELVENNTYGIKQNTHLAELMQQVKLVIWDEAPMTRQYAFEALDKTLRDILGYTNPEKRNRIFGGMTVLLGGDFRQILPVIPKAKRPEVVQSCINRSELWKCCKVFTLTHSMRVNEYTDNGDIDTRKQDFNKWVLVVRDDQLSAKKKETEDEPTWIEIPKEFLIRTAIRTPRTDDADAINEFMFKKLGGASVTYHSADEICKASTDTEDQHHLYPVEFLNTLNFP